VLDPVERETKQVSPNPGWAKRRPGIGETVGLVLKGDEPFPYLYRRARTELMQGYDGTGRFNKRAEGFLVALTRS